MNGFVYFLPNAAQPIGRAYQLPKETGLERVLEGRPLVSGPAMGPDGAPGYLFGIEGTPLTSSKETHEWRPFKLADGRITHWIGWNKEKPPGPDDLKRPKQTGGWEVKLEDGKNWIIPCLHVPNRSLTEVLVWTGDQFTWEVAKEYQEICQQSQKFRALYDLAAQEGDQRASVFEIYEFWARVIGINYHVGPVEVSCGNPLLSTSEECVKGMWFAIFGTRAAMDEDEAQKKSQDAIASDG